MALTIVEEMDITVQDLISGFPDESSRRLCQLLWTQVKTNAITMALMFQAFDSLVEEHAQDQMQTAAQLALLEEQGQQHDIRISALENDVRNLMNLRRQDQAQGAPRLNPSPSVERVEPAEAVVEKIRDYPFPKKEGLQIVISRNPCVLYRFTYVGSKIVCTDCDAQMKLTTFKRFHKLTKNCPVAMRAEIINEANLVRLEEDPDFNVDHLRV